MVPEAVEALYFLRGKFRDAQILPSKIHGFFGPFIYSITPFEERLAQGPFCMKWILDGYEMDPKNQQMDPPFLRDLNLFFTGFFLGLQFPTSDLRSHGS